MSGELDLEVLLAGADHTELARTVLAVAAMHEPGTHGRCRYCQSRRWPWSRRPRGHCPTRRVIVAELRTGRPPKWMPA
ncbi:MAG TPA: hypothetical protein VFX70_21445 [Mycobacteriales bacterium]|nr:hypothetical protein [Mycobacteriales bacterium]